MYLVRYYNTSKLENKHRSREKKYSFTPYRANLDTIITLQSRGNASAHELLCSYACLGVIQWFRLCLNWPSESDLDEEANKSSPSYYNSDDTNKQQRFEEWQRWDKVIIQNTDMSEGQTVSGKKTCADGKGIQLTTCG